MNLNYYVIPGLEHKQGFAFNVLTDIEKTNKIKDKIIERENVSHNLFMSKNRSSAVTFCRFVFYRLCRKHTKISLIQLGYLTNRDHTSVMNGLKRLQDLIDTEHKTREKVEYYERLFA